jgi:hypothetical protein
LEGHLVHAQRHLLQGTVDLLVVVVGVNRGNDLHGPHLQELEKLLRLLLLFKDLEQHLLEFEVAVPLQEEVEDLQAVEEDVLQVHLAQLELLPSRQLDEDLHKTVLLQKRGQQLGLLRVSHVQDVPR